ncbi:MAG: sigma factor-like helix-turn-helix DNA-binding protein, partial [Acidobacteriota bacterium]
ILMNLNKEKRELEARGIAPTTQLLARNLGVEESEVIEVEKGMSGSDISLDTPIGEDGGLRFADTLQMMEQSVDEKIAQGQFRELLERKFAEFSEQISEREQVILQQRLIAEEPMTLQQIADIYGITREAVRVAEKKLVAKLKRFMEDSFRDTRDIEFRVSA